MAALFQVRDASAWRTVKTLFARDASAWRDIQQAYVRDATGWRLVFQKFLVLTGLSFAARTTTSLAPTVTFVTDGTLTRSFGGGVVTAAWGTPTVTAIGNNYWVKVTTTSGTISNSGSWLALTTNRAFAGPTTTAGNDVTAGGDYQISTDFSGATVVGSGTLTFDNDRT